ncbi:MAG: hypothetical protein HC913_18500 [Microscillaceae bacterium]|nr:hypothetical protein [Microscillaceae bacterium]
MAKNFMVYEDYRKAALKHLKTCEYMIDNLGKISNDDTLDGLAKQERKEHILREIYYLLGYVLEGVVCYCIYKKVSTYQSNPNKNIYDLDDDVSSVATSIPNAHIAFHKKNSTPSKTYIYFLSTHKYANYI